MALPYTFFKILEHFQAWTIGGVPDTFFFQNGKINKITNETYITLIPKKEKSLFAANFRPISLTTSFYKIISKSLSIMLKTVLPNTISEIEIAFI